MEVEQRAKPHEAGRRARVPKPRGALPRQPLAAATRPSRRAPQGRPRCQYWDPRGDGFWQCHRAARPGFRVCGVHGAGYAKREREGLRTNPALAPIVTGTKASAATQQVLLEGQPNLRAFYDAHLRSDDLLDLRPQLALTKALVEHYINQEGTVTELGPEVATRPFCALWRLWRRVRGWRCASSNWRTRWARSRGRS